MIAFLVFVVFLALVRTASRYTSRQNLEHFAARSNPDGFIAFTDALERGGYQVVPPIEPRLNRHFSRYNRFVNLLPIGWLLAGYLVIAGLGVAPWLVSTVLAVLLTTGTATTPLRIRMKGLPPLGGRRASKEWSIIGPAMLLRTVLVAFGFYLAYKGVLRFDTGAWLLGLGLMVAAIVVWLTAHLPSLAAERIARRLRHVTFSIDTPSDAILLLRSFTDDHIRVATEFNDLSLASPHLDGILRARFEELVAWSLVGEGSLLAIGRPGEPLPELGAARTYWPDAGWQEAVARTARRVERVVMIGGISGGLAWEVEQLRSWGMLQKLLVLLPPDRPEASLTRLCSVLEDLGLSGFPFDEYEPYFVTGISFTGTSTPRVHTAMGRTSREYMNAIIGHRALVLDKQNVSGNDASRPTQESPHSPIAPVTPMEGTPRLIPPDLQTTPAASVVSFESASYGTDPSAYTLSARRCLRAARDEAEARGHDSITPAHLLLGIVTVVPGTFEELTTIDASWAATIVRNALQPSITHNAGIQVTAKPDKATTDLLAGAEKEVKRLSHNAVDTAHLVLAAHQIVAGIFAKAIPFYALNIVQARGIAASDQFTHLRLAERHDGTGSA